MKIALVLGGASCVRVDIAAALDLGEVQGCVGANDIGVAWPGSLDAWVSLHPEKFRMWGARRRLIGLPPHRRVFAHLISPTERVQFAEHVTTFTDFRLPGQSRGGSSGLFAVKVALIDLGVDRVTLCGIPMTAEGAHYFDERSWGAAQDLRRGWIEALPFLKSRVRSMSGWTAELLGQPDPHWFSAI